MAVSFEELKAKRRAQWLELHVMLGGSPDDEPEPYKKRCCGISVHPLSETKTYTSGLCINRCCVEWTCLCGEPEGGYGPVRCRCEYGGPNPLSINGRAYRGRTRARVKRRR